MESEYEEKMEELRGQLEVEKKKKNELDQELANAKNELENIEVSFPKEVADLKE